VAWTLRWGESEEHLNSLAEEGRHIQALADKPEVDGLVAEAVNLFWLLSGGRPVGFGPGPIPTTDILLGADAFGLPADWFLFVCRVMDNEFLTHHLLKEKSKEKPALNPPAKRVR
jgi:hypothetical protein